MRVTTLLYTFAVVAVAASEGTTSSVQVAANGDLTIAPAAGKVVQLLGPVVATDIFTVGNDIDVGASLIKHAADQEAIWEAFNEMSNTVANLKDTVVRLEEENRELLAFKKAVLSVTTTTATSTTVTTTTRTTVTTKTVTSTTITTKQFPAEGVAFTSCGSTGMTGPSQEECTQFYKDTGT